LHKESAAGKKEATEFLASLTSRAR